MIFYKSNKEQPRNIGKNKSYLQFTHQIVLKILRQVSVTSIVHVDPRGEIRCVLRLIFSLLPCQGSADHQTLDFAGPFINFSNLGVPHHSLHGKFAGVSVTPEYLYCLRAHLHCRLAGK